MPGNDKCGGAQRFDDREARLSRFEAEIQKGIDSANRGELIDADLVFDRLIERCRAMAAKTRA